MQSHPFRRFNEYMNIFHAFMKMSPHVQSLNAAPVFMQRKGKGKGKYPRDHGHKHMAYKRANTK